MRTTFGGYAQDSFNVTNKLFVEAGFRLDHLKDYGTFPLPRVSALYRFTNKLSSFQSAVRFGKVKSRLLPALLFEREASFKTGIEAYYTSSQFLTNRFRTRPYWVLGIFGEKMFGKYSLFINAENITDTRQGRFSQVVFPLHQMPTFSEIYAPTEGRVINGGIKIRL